MPYKCRLIITILWPFKKFINYYYHIIWIVKYLSCNLSCFFLIYCNHSFNFILTVLFIQLIRLIYSPIIHCFIGVILTIFVNVSLSISLSIFREFALSGCSLFFILVIRKEIGSFVGASFIYIIRGQSWNSGLIPLFFWIFGWGRF